MADDGSRIELYTPTPDFSRFIGGRVVTADARGMIEVFPWELAESLAMGCTLERAVAVITIPIPPPAAATPAPAPAPAAAKPAPSPVPDPASGTSG